jgi:HD superfamily phosphodiesterase
MNANLDLVVADALLHDVGKVEAYGIDGGTVAHTRSCRTTARWSSGAPCSR